MSAFLKKILTALTDPKTIILLVGVLAVAGETVDFWLDKDFVKQYGPLVAFLSGAQLVLGGALRFVRAFLPVIGFGKKK